MIQDINNPQGLSGNECASDGSEGKLEDNIEK
jgi:hypothetical protein